MRPWLTHREILSAGALFCNICGPTCRRPWSETSEHHQLHSVAAPASLALVAGFALDNAFG